ncbi:carbohydrate porin [Sphingobium lactosutens]|uniref:carbohydrate porin n=1 Tax=Sphingobium lactosutens TaxID=522773 RepID=UPI0015BDE903|nr:carbohydrate porin [Sphingobium lactosutens]
MIIMMAAALIALPAGEAVRPDSAKAVEQRNGPPAEAMPPPPPAPPADPHLLGDWVGIRSALARHGITPNIQYASEFAANLSGGTSRDATNITQLALGFTADLKKLTHVVPGTFQFTVTKRSGPRLDDEAGLGLLQFSQEAWGRGRIWRLTQAWYRVNIGSLDLKLGRMGTGEDFHSARCDFESLYFCAAGTGQVLPQYWYNYPVSTWAARLRYDIRPDLYVQTGVYQVNPRNIDVNGGGFYLGFNSGTGVLLPSEIGYSPKLFGRLVGTYKIGFLYSNAPQPDLIRDVDGGIRSRTGRPALMRTSQWAVFGNIRQQIVAPRTDGSHGLTAFFNGIWASQGTATVESKFVVGLHYSGPFAGRPKDEVAFAIGKGRLNDRLTDLQRQLRADGLSTAPIRQSEYTAELYYGFSVLPGVVMRPNVQLTLNPGGNSRRSAVAILGFKTVASF